MMYGIAALAFLISGLWFISPDEMMRPVQVRDIISALFVVFAVIACDKALAWLESKGIK